MLTQARYEGYFDLRVFMTLFMIILFWIKSCRPHKYPPGPIPLPFIGNFYNLLTGSFFKTIRDLRKTYGDIFSLSLGSHWVIVVNGIDNLREILVKRGEFTTDRPSFYVFRQGRNKGVVSASGETWKHQRAFTLSKLRDFGFGKRSFESSILEEVESFVNLLVSFKGQPFDISSAIHTSMSNNVMSITIGRRFEYDDPNFKYFVKLLNENANNAAFAGPLNFVPFLKKIPGDPFGARRISRNVRETFDFFRKEIKQHESSLSDDVRDFIDVYLKEIKERQNDQNNEFTGAQLLSIIADLFVAGTETTATGIRWAILYLINNINVQTKMRSEIEEVVGCSRLPNMSDKPNLPYCEAVIHESLRLGNIVPYSLPHKVSNDIYYKGYKIPKDSVIIPSLDSVLFDESLFPDCETFNPERFIGKDGTLCGLENVVAFSLGRRVCLGESLARMEMFLYLTALVQRFEFMPPEGEDPPPIKGRFGVTHSPHEFKMRAIFKS